MPSVACGPQTQANANASLYDDGVIQSIGHAGCDANADAIIIMPSQHFNVRNLGCISHGQDGSAAKAIRVARCIEQNHTSDVYDIVGLAKRGEMA